MYEKHVGQDTYYGPHPGGDGFGHGHINHATGYHRPPVQDTSVQAGLGWMAVINTVGKPNINIGNPNADAR